MNEFGKQLIEVDDGPMCPPSVVLEAFSLPNGGVDLTLRPTDNDTGFIKRRLNKFEVRADRLGPVVVGDILTCNRVLIWSRVHEEGTA